MAHKRGGAIRLRPFLSPSVSRCYRMNLRAKRPPPTNRTPAPRANSDATPLPPLAGSCFAGAGAGAGPGAGGGGGAAFGGGAGAALGGSGSHGALATTPPALETMYPSLHSASAVAPPALASLALASATTAGSSWARAGEAASMATASIAASIINFLNLPYLLLLESLFPSEADPLRERIRLLPKELSLFYYDLVVVPVSRQPTRPARRSPCTGRPRPRPH